MTDAVIDEIIKLYQNDKRDLIPKTEVITLLEKMNNVVSLTGMFSSFFNFGGLSKIAKKKSKKDEPKQLNKVKP